VIRDSHKAGAIRTEYRQMNGGMNVKKRQNLVLFSMETVPRPGARETRVKCLPNAVQIRNAGRGADER